MYSFGDATHRKLLRTGSNDGISMLNSERFDGVDSTDAARARVRRLFDVDGCSILAGAISVLLSTTILPRFEIELADSTGEIEPSSEYTGESSRICVDVAARVCVPGISRLRVEI